MQQKTEIIKLNNKKSDFLQIILISLTILGFETFSFIYANKGVGENDTSIYYRAFYVGLVLIIIIKHLFTNRIRFTNSFKVIILYWGIYLIRSLYDARFNPGPYEAMVTKHMYFAIFLCFLPMFALSSTISQITLENSRKTVFFLAVIVNILALINNISPQANFSTMRYNANEIINPITYGNMGVILVIMSFTSFLKVKNKYKYLTILLIIMGLANIGLAASRGPTLELLIVILFYIIINFNKTKFSKILLFLILIFIAGYFLSDYFYVFSNLFERIQNTKADEERTVLFAQSWNNFLLNPFFGFRAIGEWAHNIFLGSLEAIGILGGILIITIYKNAIKQSAELVKKQSTDWISLLLIMYLFAALISGAIWNDIIFWALLVLGSSLYQQSTYSKQK